MIISAKQMSGAYNLYFIQHHALNTHTRDTPKNLFKFIHKKINCVEFTHFGRKIFRNVQGLAYQWDSQLTNKGNFYISRLTWLTDSFLSFNTFFLFLSLAGDLFFSQIFIYLIVEIFAHLTFDEEEFFVCSIFRELNILSILLINSTAHQ